jgi:dTDP-glucose 4,6-dehydratase
MASFKSILITGGAGFIGSHVVRRMVNAYPKTKIINLDALTYASNLSLLKDCESSSNYQFVKEDISHFEALKALFITHHIDAVIHLAAESHVDQSIQNPFLFAQTNIQGTLNLLEAARIYWGNNATQQRFYHISTDEVYGSLGAGGYFNEVSAYSPRSPYSASKAASDHLVKAYFHTYGLPVVISNCSNNYGPGQHTEKLIPLMVTKILAGEPLPVYGNGLNIRDWLYVEDHAQAIDLVLHQGKIGESYTVGGRNERTNLELVHYLIEQVDQKLNRPKGSSLPLIEFVKDRLGHDYRYAIDPSKIERELGWKALTSFEKGIEKTVEFFIGK